ncbi:oxidoreductase [Coniochaeta ligniaria NRRL 30616]|uniref:Oxidoreductase n=1 Tax=Coniochaeta ligniaria NRRL 30616 TaxID=1408157 RepID=A0A1J7IU11_9PEZI|nr:oxidoreductase [Coniochaeta ligniaria NRRL 30616]
MSRPWILLCPSTRGVGRALTQHLLRTTTLPILATARADPRAAKDDLLSSLDDDNTNASSRLHVTHLDVTSESSVRAASEHAASLFPKDKYHLHLGFALPGVLYPEKSPAQVDYAHALETFKVNTLGPLLLMKWFHDFLPRKSTPMSLPSSKENLSSASGSGGSTTTPLPRHAVWATMSARVGSVSDNRLGGWYSYRASKAGVNSLTKSFDHQLVSRAGDKAIAVGYHPGTVKTELSKDYWETTAQDSLLAPEDAARMMADVVMGGVGVEGRGRCWDYKGEEVLP